MQAFSRLLSFFSSKKLQTVWIIKRLEVMFQINGDKLVTTSLYHVSPFLIINGIACFCLSTLSLHVYTLFWFISKFSTYSNLQHFQYIFNILFNKIFISKVNLLRIHQDYFVQIFLSCRNVGSFSTMLIKKRF